jgi:hypothetical protein
MTNFGIIKEGAVKLWKNPVLLVPTIFAAIAEYILMALFFLAIAAVSGISFSLLVFSSDTITNALLSDSLALVIIFGALLAVAMVLIGSFFSGMFIGMVNSKKINLDFGPGAKFFSRMLAFNVLFSLYSIIAMAVIMLLSMLALKVSVWLMIIPVIICVAFLISLPLFALGSYYIVIKDLNAIDAIKKSSRIVWKNYFRILGIFILLLIIYIVLMVVLGLIPIVGTVCAGVILGTYIGICMYMFALEKAK